MKASRQWASRPSDERFVSLDDLVAHTAHQRDISTSRVISSRKIEAAPIEGDDARKSLVVVGPDGNPAVPTHWSFGQLAARVDAPAGYLRSLPADIAADAINWGLYKRDVEEVGVLLRQNGGPAEMAAMTGPNYGRIWNSDIARQLRERFGDGVNGDFTIPGEFGRAVEPSKENTTIYASDRDMFVFLADEKNRIEIPDRRFGRSGSLARGFFVWNSEVGSKTFGIATFLFDYVCSNRIVWGAQEFGQFTLRHTSGAPDRFLEEAIPAIKTYANKSSESIVTAITAAKGARLDADKVDEFLAKRFTRNQAKAIALAHKVEEDRPIENLWDVAVGATAYARGIQFQNERVDIERIAGKIIAEAA
jgi:hypothetical protein